MNLIVTLDRSKNTITCSGFKVRYKYLFLNNKSSMLYAVHKDAELIISALLGQKSLDDVRAMAECTKGRVSVVVEMEAIKRVAEDIVDAASRYFDVMIKQQTHDGANYHLLDESDVAKLKEICIALEVSAAIRYQYQSYRSVTENMNKQKLGDLFNRSMKIFSDQNILPILLQNDSLKKDIEAAQRYFSKESTLAELNQTQPQSLEASRKHLYRFVLKLDDINKYIQDKSSQSSR